MDSLIGSDTEVGWIFRPPAVQGNGLSLWDEIGEEEEEDNKLAPWDEIGEEEVTRWRRDGELGLEEALRQAGCCEQSVIRALRAFTDASSEVFESSEELNLRKRIETLSGMSQFSDTSEVLYLNEWSEQLYVHDIIHHIYMRQFSDTICATVGRGIGPKIIKFGPLRLECTYPAERDIIAFCVNLSSNTYIEELEISNVQAFGTVEICTCFANALGSNSTLRYLKFTNIRMEYGAVTCLANGLRSNTTLLSLDLDLDLETTGYDGFEDITGFLATNSSLEVLHLDLFNLDNEDHGTELLPSALEQNTTLRILHLSTLRYLRLSQVLRPLYPHGGRSDGATAHGGTNTTVKELSVGLYTQHDWMDVTELIRTNKSLLTLRIDSCGYGESHSEGFFPALKENETLRTLAMTGLDTKFVVPGLVDVLRDNESMTRLEEIIILNTPKVHEELRINQEYRYALRRQKLVPTIFGRLVMCGGTYAGKTTICKTMKHIDAGIQHYQPWTTMWKKLMEAFPALHQFLFGRDAHRDIANRTRGCDILDFQNQQYLKSVWDFAGQREYYALHEYIFPDVKNSCFLYVCSCKYCPSDKSPKEAIKDQQRMRDECEYWLKFLASNSKPSGDGSYQKRQLPRVIFVLTKTDNLAAGDCRNSIRWAGRVVHELRELFKDVIDLFEKVEIVNSHSHEDVDALLKVVDNCFKETLADQKEYSICSDVRGVLHAWSAEIEFKPVLNFEKFCNLCQEKLVETGIVQATSNEIWKIILAYLNDIGEVIFIKGCDFIVTNPRWFGVGILGCLTDAFKGAELRNGPCCLPLPSTIDHRGAFVEKDSVEDLLEESLKTMHLEQPLNTEQLIRLMIDLEICFRVDQENIHSVLFFPILADDTNESAAKGERQLHWKINLEKPGIYLGRRLQCAQEYTMFLTPGFFPKLQVHLRNLVYSKGWTRNEGFAVERNLIQFSGNGVEVCMEYSGDTGYFVDILVRSHKTHEKTLTFLEEHVVEPVIRFCASPQGCQGVDLVEAVIRPVCVKELHLCKFRKEHSVLVSELEQELDNDDHYMHTWSQRLEFANVIDSARDLLYGKGSHERFIRSKQPIADILRSSNSNDLPQLPKLFHLSIGDVGILNKLNKIFSVSKVMPIKLHLLCDHKDGSHEVDGQPGREMKLKWAEGGLDFPILELAVRLVRAAANNAGAPLDLPQIDNWISKSFGISEMSHVDVARLRRISNLGEASRNASDQNILRTFQRYLDMDPYTQSMKEILNLEDGKAFRKEFRLQKVVYTEPHHSGRIGWVCDTHYEDGLREGILQSRPHS